MKRTSMKKTMCISAATLLSVMLGGCTTQKTADKPEGQMASEPAPAPKSHSWGYYSPRLGENEAATKMAFPTGDPKTSALLLHQVTPVQVNRGQDFDFSYHITNLTSANLQNVLVNMSSASNLDINNSAPKASNTSDGMTWAMGDFGPGETKVISMNGRADKVGIAGDCISVSYNNFLCATLNVVEPALALTKTATETALKCDTIVLRYVVKNTGTGCAENVVITDTLPAGMTLENGSGNVSIPVGQLCEGEARAFEARAQVSEPGTYSSPAMASADGDMSAKASETNTVVTAPELAVTAKCQSARYLGRNMTYSYTLENIGNGVASSATASATIPAGTTLVSASAGGVQSGSNVNWDLGNLSPDAKRDFSITVRAANAGDYSSAVTANASCADSVSDSCSTPVNGIPAILLEVVDIDDPIELGAQTTYVITVTNQGTAADTNIRVVAELPGEMSFVSGSGSTSVNASGSTLRFSPVATLAAGDEVSWRVVVRADGEGDVRFAIEMTSDELTSPVNETEATRLYK